MQNVPPQPPELEPSVIDLAPVEPDALEINQAVTADIAARLEASEAELAQLRARKTIDDVKAELLAPYANKVFWFVVWYCIAVGAILVVDAVGGTRFHLSDTILGIIAGSTAVSVIGLIGAVVTGLFHAGKSK